MPHVCTIIPPHISRAIVASNEVDDEIKHCHRYTLEKTASIRGFRVESCHSLRSAQQETTHLAATGGSSHHRHGIIPPQIHQHIAQSAEEAEQRDAAASTLERDTKHRLARQPKKDTPSTTGLNRTIYDFKHSEDETKLPGTVVDIKEGGAPVPTSKDKSGDPNEAYDGFGDTYNFYKQFFNRDSIDNKGLPLIGSVHFGTKYQNAFWDGKQMVFGDGDGTIFLDFTSRPDV